MATILTKKKDTTGAPLAGDLTNSSGGAELAVNTADKRLYTKDSGGNVVEIGTAPSTIDINAGTIDGTAIGANSASTGSFTTLTASGQTTVTGNSASTPAVSPVGDTNTGIFFPAADTIAFAEGGAEAMRIDASGNVGIGVTPSAWTNTFKAIQLGSQAALSSVADYTLLSANYWKNGGTDTFIGTGRATLYQQQVGVHSWLTSTASGTAGNAITFTECMRINTSGNLLVGTTSSLAKLTVSESTNATQAVYFDNTNASFTNRVMSVNADRNTTNGTYTFISCSISGVAEKFRVLDSGNVQNSNNSYGSLSDVKLKQDIVDAASQWDDIKNLRVRKYRWKSDPDGFMQIGVVAQEAEEVSPGLVEEHPDYEEVTRTREVEKTRVVTEAVLDEDGNEIEPAVTETYTEEEEYTEREPTGTVTKAVKYSVLYMKAVKALQEAMERIEALEASNTALEARIAALEN